MLFLELLVSILLASAQDVEALRATAPRYLTTEKAVVHLAAARVAASETGTEPELLLSIAHHESRYSYTEITPEAGGKVSCGVMTPEPTYSRAACRDATSSVLAGYLVGARHLRGWIDACARLKRKDRRCALLGYAGGYYLINYCARQWAPACGIPKDFETRARRIWNGWQPVTTPLRKDS